MALQIYDPATGTTRDATTDDFATVRPLTPLSSVIALSVTTTSQTLAALVGGGGIDATCNWITLQMRDDMTNGQIVRINYSGAASATSYDATISLDSNRLDGPDLTGKGSKALFDAFQLIGNAAATVLLRQFREV